MSLNRQFVLFAILPLLSLSSCKTRSPAPSALNSAVSTIRDYENSFKGLTEEAAKGRLAGAKLKEEKWASGGFGGKKLDATFPEYELSLLFSGDKIVTASFSILTE